MTRVNDCRRRLSRLFWICNAVQNRRIDERLTRASMAQECECTERSIARDLQLLREIGVDIAWDAAQRSFVLRGSLPFYTTQLSQSQALSLALSRELITSQTQTPFAWQAEAAFQQLFVPLPAPLRALIEEAAATPPVHFDGRTRRRYDGSCWKPLVDATRQHRTIELRYFTPSRGEESTRLVDPYALFERDGYWLLAAWCHKRGDVLQFALDRIRNVTLTPQTFVNPQFDLDKYLEGSLNMLRGEKTRIVLRFSARLAHLARRRLWNFPHEMHDETDGGLRLSGEVSGTEEIRVEVLKWGSAVEVLEPPTLREAVYREACAIAALYAEKPDTTSSTRDDKK